MKVGTTLLQQALSMVFAALVLQFSAGASLAAQQQSAPAPLGRLSPDQLDNLVAPIALYPDALLSQVLVASTYPLELVEAEQWLERNQNLQGPPLVDAARQQNWDPSIQALVVFPDVIGRLNSNIRWTTDLGNAFLAQQADVMNAVQRLRMEARAAGKLNATTEETIATDTQGGQTAIEIQPTNPDVMYVPSYNPQDVWGPPDYGDYPPLDYPDVGYGFDFGPGIYLDGFFGGLGWGGWGWGPNWLNCSIFENRNFFSHYGFRGFDGRGFGERGTWSHNAEHRLGVAYPNHQLANRFGGNFGNRGSFAGVAQRGGSFGASGLPAPHASLNARSSQWNRFGSSGFQSNYRTSPAYRVSRAGAAGYRSAPSYGGYGGIRTMPDFRSRPSVDGGGFRSAPSFGGGHSGGGGFHSFGGGGVFHGGGGGASHGGGHR